jgi:predicted RNA-binding Zn-ribbon protein involved in translation (DUF1610 family)
MKKPCIRVFDIEASNLSADFGFVHCIAWKDHGEKSVHILNRWDFSPPQALCDKDLLKAFWTIAAEADMLIAHYGVKRSGFDFDLPFLNSRYLANKLKPFPECKYEDTHTLAKRNLKLSSNALGQVASFLGVKQQKQHLPHYKWTDVLRCNKKAMKEMSDYCKQDVRTLDAVWNELRCFSKKVPNFSVYADGRLVCPNCGEERYRALGNYSTATALFKRYICMACGRTFRTDARDKKPR